MLVELNFDNLIKDFNSRYWDSVEDFIDYELQRHAESHQDRILYTDQFGQIREINYVNHFPELKEYEVWMEGYAATGESGSAHLVGKVKARCFAQACHYLMCKQQMEYIEKVNNPDYDGNPDISYWAYDPNRLSYWACRLFWNEKLARKSFG